MNFLKASFLFVALVIVGQGEAWATDHGGKDWTPAANEQISGTHTNVGAFTVPAGRTVYVRHFDGSHYGTLHIEAENIYIKGTLSAIGRGYGGGGGGGGGPGTVGPAPGDSCAKLTNTCAPSANGAAGTGYAGGANGGIGTKSCANKGTSYSGVGGKGGGSYGGSGAVSVSSYGWAGGPKNGNHGARGGYRVNIGQGDNSINETVWMGSGGGGGSGGANAYERMHSSVGGGGGGGAGGSGGGAITLISEGALEISGQLLAKGADGGGDGAGGDDGYRGGSYHCDLSGSGGAGGLASSLGTGAGAVGTTPHFVGNSYNSCIGRSCNAHFSNAARVGGTGGQGGAGAGGGILLKGNDVDITGTVDNRGGDNVTANGGTLKIFHCDLDLPANQMDLTGRLLITRQTICNIDIGLRLYDGGKVRRIAAERVNPPTSPLQMYRAGRAYGLALVDPSHEKATRARVRVGGAVWALRDLD